jgi:hypothetical protein
MNLKAFLREHELPKKILRKWCIIRLSEDVEHRETMMHDLTTKDAEKQRFPFALGKEQIPDL